MGLISKRNTATEQKCQWTQPMLLMEIVHPTTMTLKLEITLGILSFTLKGM